MKKNTIYKILFSKKNKINFSKKSINTYVSYKEVLNFISKALNNNIFGIFNLQRVDYQNYDDIKKIFKSDIKFGKFVFKCIKANNNKIQTHIKLNKKSSIDILKEFLYEKSNNN